MERLRPGGVAVFLVGMLVAACSSSDDGAAQTAGAAGRSTATGGGSATGGAATSSGSGDGGATSGPGGTTGSGGDSNTGGAGGSADNADAAAGSGGAAGAAGTGIGGDASVPVDGGSFLQWYEAEAVPPNQLGNGASIVNCGAPACPSIASIKEGDECCSGGKKVGQILGRRGGYLQVNAIAAPSDGMYDVTWWYHCGKSDNFGDTDCGGQPHTPAGCRPHQFVVNGTQLPKIYHFPCFAGSWGQIHASTVSLPLKAGATNSIRVSAPNPRDAADMDAIALYPPGKGVPPLIVGTDR